MLDDSSDKEELQDADLGSEADETDFTASGKYVSILLSCLACRFLFGL